MSDEAITPTESELKAVKSLHAASDGESLLGETHAAAIIATHTRHEGKTAQEWAELAHYWLNEHGDEAERRGETESSHSEALQRAEAAEARVKELEHAIQAALNERESCRVLMYRIDELKAYKQRIELAIKCSETSISDELIRRKQAEALRRWDEQKVDGMSALEYAAAIRRGEVVL